MRPWLSSRVASSMLKGRCSVPMLDMEMSSRLTFPVRGSRKPTMLPFPSTMMGSRVPPVGGSAGMNLMG